jgi:hypothetical protein
MSPIEAVLRLRPANAANRLGPRSRACLLGARDLQRYAAGHEGAVVCFALPIVRPLAHGVFRAARQLDAAIGLGAPARGLGEGPRPWAVFEEVVAAAEEVGFRQPFFLRGGPVLLGDATEAQVARVGQAVFELIDAGFTEVALDATALPLVRAAAAVAQGAKGARERELSVDVVATGAEPADLAEFARALDAQAALPGVVSVMGEVAQDEARAHALERAVAPAVLGLVEAPFAGALGGRARRVVLERRFDALLEHHLPLDLLEAMRLHRLETGATVAAAAGRFERELAALNQAVRDRLEAFAYYEAREALLQAGARMSGSGAVRFLAEHGCAR